MNLAAMMFDTSGLLSLLLFVAIAAVVIWAIHALIVWAGWVIPPPVKIVFIALLCIVAIIFLFRIFGLIT